MNPVTGTAIPHILLLEDDRAHQDLVIRAFRDDPEQFRVSIAGTVKKAREIIDSDPPALIIADWILPDGKGIEILPRRDGMVLTPLILMTSYGDEHLTVEMMKSGAIDYVVKSATSFKDLPQIARRAMRDWKNIRERRRAEDTAREYEKRLGDILGFLPDAVLAIDNDGRVIAWNNAIEQMTGAAAKDMLGKGDHEYSIPFYGERRPILIDQVLCKDPEIEKKYDSIRFDGERVTSESFVPTIYGGKGGYLWGTATPLYDSPGNRIGAIEVIRDITDQKKAELALQESETRFRALIQNSSDIIRILDQDGRIMYESASAERILGYPPGYTTGKDPLEYVHPDDFGRVKNYLSEVYGKMKDDIPTEFRIRKADGEYLWVDSIGTNLLDVPGVNGIVVTTRPIQQRKLAEESLQENEERFRHISYLISDFAYSCSRAQDGPFITDWMTGALEKISGYTTEEIYTMNCWRPIVFEDDLPVFDRDIVGLSPGESRRSEIRIRNKEGGIIWLASFAECIIDPNNPSHHRLYGGCRNITERKRVDAALLDEVTRRRILIDQSRDGIVVLDENGGVYEANQRFAEMLGYSPEEVRQLHIWDWDTQRSKEQLMEMHRTVDAAGDNFETRYRRKDGTMFTVEISTNGSVVSGKKFVFCVCHDITDRNLMVSEIRSLNTVLEQRVRDRTDALSKVNEALEEENTQRLVAEEKLKKSYDEKVLLLKEIHHRVKNNLQIIASLLNLQSRYITDEPTLAAIRESQNRVKAMALVHEKLYRAEDIAHISLHEYLRFLGTGLFQFYDAKAREIRFSLEVSDVNVDIDAAIPIGLIINELISNSLKYAFPKGMTGEVTISVKKEGHTLYIQYQDTGIGIPADLDWRNAPSLGLRLVTTLVDQMDGTVELNRSNGTLFTMVLHEKESGGPS